jgi:hypothetical protein
MPDWVVSRQHNPGFDRDVKDRSHSTIRSRRSRPAPTSSRPPSRSPGTSWTSGCPRSGTGSGRSLTPRTSGWCSATWSAATSVPSPCGRCHPVAAPRPQRGAADPHQGRRQLPPPRVAPVGAHHRPGRRHDRVAAPPPRDAAARARPGRPRLRGSRPGVLRRARPPQPPATAHRGVRTAPQGRRHPHRVPARAAPDVRHDRADGGGPAARGGGPAGRRPEDGPRHL